MPSRSSEVEQLLSSADLVVVGHYLYAGEVVRGFDRILSTTSVFEVIGHGQRERDMYMRLLCGKSLRKEQKRGEIVARGEGRTRANSGRGGHQIKIARLLWSNLLENVADVRVRHL